MAAASFIVMSYLKRFIRLMFGLFLLSVGVYFTIQANVGLSPWEALSAGLDQRMGISFGNANLIVGLLIIGTDILLKEKIGIGSILNAVLVGKFVDALDYFKLVPMQESFFKGILFLLLGQFILCIGCYFYMGSEFGCGPRDTFMVAFCRRFEHLPIGAVRFAIELTVLILGFVLGAKVGIGSAISMFGISFMLQMTFTVLHFDVKALNHENIAETLRNLKKSIKKT